MADLQNKKIAFLVANEGVEQVELTEPWKAVEQAGAKPELISLEAGQVQAFNHLDKADTFDVDRTVADADASDTTGWCCRAAWRTRTSCAWTSGPFAFARSFFESGKPVGVICHGPWTLVEADVVRDRTHHVMAQPANRHPERGRQMGRRGGRRGRGPRVEPQARRPAGFLRQDRRGVRRGPPRRASAPGPWGHRRRRRLSHMARATARADRLVEQLRPHIRDERVLAAIATVPRGLFVPRRLMASAWENTALPIGAGQTISQPVVVARMCELLELQGDERVLDVGTGSGYHAAVLAQLAAEVWSIEREPQLSHRAAQALEAAGVHNVHLLIGDGSQGHPAAAPYDAINVAAAASGSRRRRWRSSSPRAVAWSPRWTGPTSA